MSSNKTTNEELASAPLNSGENTFGEGQYGPRLDQAPRPCRDLFCAIIYYLHLAAILAVVIYFWSSEVPDLVSEVKKQTDTNTNSSILWIDDFDWDGVIVALIACALIGISIGLCWLCVLRKFAKIIIETMLICNIIAWIALTIFGAVTNDTPLLIWGIVFSLLAIIYTICIWKRIEFSSVLLSISSKIVSSHNGTIFLSFVVIMINVIWILLWFMCMWGYIAITTGDEYNGKPNGWIIFVLLISLYWGMQVNKNIVHTATCGVTGIWYFSPSNDHKATCAALGHAITTSFGSICFGSFFVALIDAIRAMVNAMCKDRNNRLAKCCLMCCINCLESAMKWFNQYAFAHCAIYGTGYLQSAKASWGLLETRGFTAVINDDLTGLGVFCGSLFGFVITGLTGLGISHTYYHDYDDAVARNTVMVSLSTYGAIIGYIMCYLVLHPVRSAVVALFVCFAEDPEAMRKNRQESYDALVGVKPEMASSYDQVNGADDTHRVAV